MTKKRFEYDKDTCCFLDYNEWGIKGKSIEEIEKLLNALHEENTKMKEALKELKEIGDYQSDRIKELDEENQQIESTIKEAYQSERTQLGKSVLKQLMETIQ